MIPRALRSLVLLGLLAHGLAAAVPTTKYYPFPGYDLAVVRAKTKAESSPDSADMREAVRLYHDLQGSWKPHAPKPSPEALAQFDQLQAKLEALPKPAWYLAAVVDPQVGHVQLAEKIGDETFVLQKATPEYQAQKALAIVYLIGHGLNREGATNAAGRQFALLSMTHPWDWQVHSIYSRFLIDAHKPGPAWQTAVLGLFLNPDPSQQDLEYLAYVGCLTVRDEWPAVQEVMRQAARDDRVAELAIANTDKLYSADLKETSVMPKKP